MPGKTMPFILSLLVVFSFALFLNCTVDDSSTSGGSTEPTDPDPYPPLPVEDTTINVNTLSQLNTALGNMKAGHTIILANGTYSGYISKITGKIASEAHPVVIKAATNGGAAITLDYAFNIKECKYITFQGFVLKADADSWGILTIENSKYIKIIDNEFDCSPLSNNTSMKPLILKHFSDTIEIGYNYFHDKNTGGGFITTEYYDDTDGQGISTNVFIHHNYLKNMIFGGTDCDREAIVFGDSESQIYTTNNIVEYNLFEDCDGENEIITVKVSDVVIRYNTFKNCYGSVTLRFGEDHKVYSNFFYGDNTANNADTGGIRIYGKNQLLYNNYFENLKGSGFRMPILIDGGDYDGSGVNNNHYRVHGAIVVFNTLYNCATGIGVGVNYTMDPLDSFIANNIIVGTTGDHITIHNGSSTNTWQGNMLYPNAPTKVTIDDGSHTYAGLAILESDPGLTQDATSGLYFLLGLSSSPAANAALGTYPAVTDDIQGDARSSKDIGCDEYGTSGLRTPLTVSDVGPR